MARRARLVARGMPHHVVQRGNRRQKVFFEKEDRRRYLRLLEDKAGKYNLEVLAYCLMDNHVHLVVVPSGEKEKRKGTVPIWGQVNREVFRKGNL